MTMTCIVPIAVHGWCEMTDNLPPALDVACGGRSFYFDKQDDRVLKCDAFDPPHLDVGAGWQVDKYGKLDSDSWHEDLAKGFSECLRVLKPYGVLVFKWYEYHIPLKDVLKLCPAKPIIGNRRPKASKTHWVLFMREPETLEQAVKPADDCIDN